jgi:hypothetical protein
VKTKEYFDGVCTFLAPLANVSGHVKALALGAPFKVERWSLSKLVSALMEASDLPDHEVLSQLDSSQVTRIKRGSEFFRSDHVYVVVGEIRFQAEDILELHRKTDRITNLLEQKLSIVRLFYQGDICISGIYWDAQDEPYAGNLSTMTDENFRERDTTNFTKWGVARVNDILERMKLPFKYSYLNLALDHLEEARKANSIHMQFLALMIGLEVIFNIGPQDIKYRITRSAAVLLGEDGFESDRFFEWTRKLYDLRSKLVHTGASKEISRDEVWKSRLLLRKSIVAAYQSELDKAELMNTLSRQGFGQWPQKPWYYTT